MFTLIPFARTPVNESIVDHLMRLLASQHSLGSTLFRAAWIALRMILRIRDHAFVRCRKLLPAPVEQGLGCLGKRYLRCARCP